MAFLTDKQTMDDLNVFGKHGSESVYSLFNRTRTAGGGAILEEMFLYPLSNPDAINERINIIRQVAHKRISFPFNQESFGLIEHYLENTDERSKLSHDQNTLGKQLINLITSDIEFKLLQKGAKSLRELLIELWKFLHDVSLEGCPEYSKNKESLISILAEEPFASIVRQKSSEPITNAQVAGYDTLFRFKKRPVIRQMLQFIYHLDVYVAVATVATERNFCFPEALPRDEGMNMENVYHPMIKNAVGNTIDIAMHRNVIFLTGANMAGKSTFMKTLGIALYLAHVGFPLPASKMQFGVMNGLYTTINLPDNLGMGASHFYAEVLRVKKVAKELSTSKKLFVIFDELFRGTNVKDAYEATVAIISAFAKKRNSMFVISTHIIEAGEALKNKCSNIRFLYLPTRMNKNVPVYTYTLEEGITDDRHGMIIVRNEGILDILKRNEELTPFF